MNLNPRSPSWANVNGSGSRNHLNDDDQLNANRASGKRFRTSVANVSTGSAVGRRELAPDEVRDARVEVAQARSIASSMPRCRLRCVDRRQAVGASDDREVLAPEVVGDGAHHPQLADHLLRRHERLAADVAAALGQHLVLQVRCGDAGRDEQLGLALDVEDVAVARVHVDDDRRDVEEAAARCPSPGHRRPCVSWNLRSAAHGASRAIGDLRRRCRGPCPSCRGARSRTSSR